MNRLALRQLVVGLVVLPLSALPFLAYLTFTPEGRLVRDKVVVAVAPPKLPSLSLTQHLAAAGIVPSYSGRVMALVYHGIGTSSDAEGGYVVSAERFGEHLATLQAAGMHVVTAADIAWSLAAGIPLPDRAVMLSFDDGRTDALLFADPLLKQAGMKATMFVISEAAARPGLYYAGWDRLVAAARSGRWDIEAHSDGAHHLQRVAGGEELPALTSLVPGETLAEYQTRVHDDLERNSAAILAHIGQRPVAFAYPFGAHGTERTNDPRIEAILRDEVARRFVVAFHQDDQHTIPLVDPAQPRIGLRRLSVQDWSGMELLHHIARAVAVTAEQPPPGTSDPVVKSLPAIPFLSELRQRSTSPAGARTAPPPTTATTGSQSPTTTTQPPAPGTAPTTTTTSLPPTTSTTTRLSTTTSTGPPTTTSTSPPSTGTTSTTTTTPSCHDNRDSCKG